MAENFSPNRSMKSQEPREEEVSKGSARDCDPQALCPTWGGPFGSLVLQRSRGRRQASCCLLHPALPRSLAGAEPALLGPLSRALGLALTLAPPPG